MAFKNAKILVVDDDPDVLTAVKLLLKTEVNEVVTEKSPENIRWLLSKHNFDVILLDMPLTGPAWGNCISQQENSKRLKRILTKQRHYGLRRWERIIRI